MLILAETCFKIVSITSMHQSDNFYVSDGYRNFVYFSIISLILYIYKDLKLNPAMTRRTKNSQSVGKLHQRFYILLNP